MKSVFSIGGLALDIGVLRANRRWLIALGAGLLVCGIIALLSIVEATVVTVLWVGAMMIVAGIMEIVHSFKIRDWGRSLFLAIIGSLYVFGGFFAVLNPLHTSLVLTLVLGIVLIIAGVTRIIVGLRVKGDGHSGWIVLSGLATALLGLIILIHWPFSSFYALGIILGVNLIQSGFGWIGLGLRLGQGGGTA